MSIDKMAVFRYDPGPFTGVMDMNLSRVILVCPRNDAESALIHLVATAIGMRVITSTQGVGATLDAEPIIEEMILRAPRVSEVWIVEIPGPEAEERIRASGRTVTIIDHHAYGNLVRTHNAVGERLRSSLEQFLSLAGMDVPDLQDLKLDPLLVHGIGIFDDRYAQGLRDWGYRPHQIKLVLHFRELLIRGMNVQFDASIEAARLAWDRRETRGDYTVVRATDRREVRGEVGILTIANDCDTRPLIVIESDGRATFVQNVEPSVVERLRAAFDKPYNTFTFGAGRCWGADSTTKGERLDPQRVFDLLGI